MVDGDITIEILKDIRGEIRGVRDEFSCDQPAPGRD